MPVVARNPAPETGDRRGSSDPTNRDGAGPGQSEGPRVPRWLAPRSTLVQFLPDVVWPSVMLVDSIFAVRRAGKESASKAAAVRPLYAAAVADCALVSGALVLAHSFVPAGLLDSEISRG